MRITILTGASSNCFSRAYFLAKALSRHYEIDIVGLTDSRGMWPAFDTGEYSLSGVRMRTLPSFVRTAKEAQRLLTGDVIYALKLKTSTYGIALLRKWSTGKPVVLDMDDWEVGLLSGRRHLILNSLLSLHQPDAYPYLLAIEKLTRWADAVTVVSDSLEQRFGGVRVPHGRDVHWLDPSQYDRSALRRRSQVDGQKIILWWGTPTPHKGIDDLIRAVKLLNRSDVTLLVVGANRDHKLARELQEAAGDLLRLEGVRPNSELPGYLAIADLIVIPQKRGPGAEAQIPAKIHEAMAMEKPIVGTAVSDIPRILDGCGLVVDPESPEQLAEAMARLLDDDRLSAELGRRAREKCIREYSIEAMEAPLQQVFDRFSQEVRET